MTDYSALVAAVDNFRNKRILCVGDVMLDRYVYGDVERISPEAPIPVLSITREESMLGASGNVAKNIARLGAAVDFYCVVGDDKSGIEIKSLLEKESGITSYISTSSAISTTVKTRFLSGSQQILRVDSDQSGKPVHIFQPEVISHFDGIVISDYAKGALSENIIFRIIEVANAYNIPIVVDSKSPIAQYQNATVYTPNLGELARATLQREADLNDDAIVAAAQGIINCNSIRHILVTRASKGMTLCSGLDAPIHIPAMAKEVFDVVGAGDTVAAVLALGLACGLHVSEAAFIANIAGGIVVGKRGTAFCAPMEIKIILLRMMESALERV